MTSEQLALQAQRGDENAMQQLLESYKSVTNSIARSYFLIGGDMEDIVQEGMIGLYKAIRSFRPDKNASFKTFAVLCIKHQIQTAIKKASAEKNKILSTAMPIWEQSEKDEDFESKLEIILPSPLPGPDESVIASENWKELKQQLHRSLSKLEMKVLSLYLQGYCYDEIAAFSALNKKSIDNALTRIKNKLSFLKKAE